MLPTAVNPGMITNREISSAELLAEAVDEIIESARENDVSDQKIATELETRVASLSE
jgi:hypothetical protein